MSHPHAAAHGGAKALLKKTLSGGIIGFAFKLFVACVFGLLWLAAFVAACQWLVIRAGKGKLYSEIDTIPTRQFGLLLGTSERLGNGDGNWFFQYRIAAAAALYKAGRVKHLLVSGDNSEKHYDEPAAMTRALVAAGVPASAITVDDAGFRTLDSVVRARFVFGLKQFTVISQQFQNERAIMIADNFGIDAIGFCAQDVPVKYSMRTRVREVLARVKVFLDIYILHTRPKFLGKPISVLVS